MVSERSTSSTSLIGAALAVGMSFVFSACRSEPRDRTPSAASMRISMEEMHAAGGVPPGWRFTPPPGDVAAGRTAFRELGCHSCHAIKGEEFAATASGGPDLTAMGDHHPPEYFAEAILNPDAVLIEGPNYVGADGHSAMPAYPAMTLAQLADLVAYLGSLTGDGGHFGHGHSPPAPAQAASHPFAPRPVPPPIAAASFFVQIYDVKEGKLGEFEQWFRQEGAPQFLSIDGLLGIDSYVDNTREGPSVVSIFNFETDAARERFLTDHGTAVLGQKFDEFIGPHLHRSYRRPPLYRAPSLSAP